MTLADMKDLDFQYPLLQDSNFTPTWNTIQAKRNGQWVPEWIIIDRQGEIVAHFTLEEPVTPEGIAKAAYDIIRDMHGIGVRETGHEGVIQRLYVTDEGEE